MHDGLKAWASSTILVDEGQKIPSVKFSFDYDNWFEYLGYSVCMSHDRNEVKT